MKHNVDVVRIRENEIELNGWAIGKTPETEITYRVEDGARRPMDFRFVRTRRDDVSQIYFGETVPQELGFDIKFPYERGKDYYLIISGENRNIRIKYNEELVRKRSSASHKRMRKLLDLANMETVRVCLDYWKENGFRALIKKSKHKIQGIDSDYDYPEWYSLTRPSTEELSRQREEEFPEGPMFSIVIPAYKTPKRYLREMLDSIADQTYGNFEVCVADGSPAGESVGDILAEYAGKDKRFRYEVLGENRGIAGNTNAAMAMAKGDYIVLADHDDTITPDALYECAKLLREHPGCEMFYSDEDKLDMDGGALFDPHFKPDFNPDLLCSVNYICHLLCVKRTLAEKTGGFRQEFDGAQDYDFIFRCAEEAREVRHIPKVLYHWRCHKNSTASNPESKMYAFEAGARAIMAHYDRMGIPYEKVEKGVDFGIYHTTWKIVGNPLISIIIPNRESPDLLKKCISAVRAHTRYENYEVIIVENNSSSGEILDCYRTLRAEGIRVVRWKAPDGRPDFNFSAINNFGERFAKGEYLVFLNNDVEVTEGWLEELLSVCERPDVGAAGAKLVYPDGRIQSAGIVVGIGQTAGSLFAGMNSAYSGYLHKASLMQDLSAVTAALMIVRRSVFQKVGGFDEDLAVAFNDVDLCLKIRAEGLLVVYDPFAQAVHDESVSRGDEYTKDKAQRFRQEAGRLKEKWPAYYEEGDPYYNPNFSLSRWDYTLQY